MLHFLVVTFSIYLNRRIFVMKFRSDYANAQVDLNLRLAHMSEGSLSDDTTHIHKKNI